MKILAIVLALAALSACAPTTGAGAIKPEESTEQFVKRVIASTGGVSGF